MSQSEEASQNQEYRQHLVLAGQKAQEDYDKTLVLISGGAIGISFTFIDRLASGPPFAIQLLLFAAWGCWAGSIAAVFISYFLSRKALGKAIDQFDNKRKSDQTEPEEKPGGRWSTATEVLNIVGGLSFIVGLAVLGLFVWNNMPTEALPNPGG